MPQLTNQVRRKGRKVMLLFGGGEGGMDSEREARREESPLYK